MINLSHLFQLKDCWKYCPNDLWDERWEVRSNLYKIVDEIKYQINYIISLSLLFHFSTSVFQPWTSHEMWSVVHFPFAWWWYKDNDMIWWSTNHLSYIILFFHISLLLSHFDQDWFHNHIWEKGNSSPPQTKSNKSHTLPPIPHIHSFVEHHLILIFKISTLIGWNKWFQLLTWTFQNSSFRLDITTLPTQLQYLLG